MISPHSFKAEGISKKFGTIQALDQLGLELASGQICLLAGANGSGKSTFLRICAGLLLPDGGTISTSNAVKLSYLGHHCQLYGALSVRENLQLVCDLIAHPVEIDSELREWGLGSICSLTVDQLSKGQAAKVALCRTLMHRPNLIFLDEPSSNLDDQAFSCLAAKLTDLKRSGATCLIASHDLFRIRKLVDRVVLIKAGRVCLDGAGADVIEVLNAYAEANR